jgi:hypothetical protein
MGCSFSVKVNVNVKSLFSDNSTHYAKHGILLIVASRLKILHGAAWPPILAICSRKQAVTV